MNDTTTYSSCLAFPLAGFFCLFFIAPVVLLFVVSAYSDVEMTVLGPRQYLFFFSDQFSLAVLARTLLVGTEVSLFCMVLGYPIAWLFVRTPRRLQSALMLLLLLPLLTSVVVRTFSWIVILGRQGLVNTFLLQLGLIDAPLRLLYSEGGLVVALGQVHMPMMVLPLITTLSRINPSLAEASTALGAGHWRTFFRVTLPLSIPGLLAGCMLTFATSSTAMITQSLIGGGQKLLMPLYIYQQALSSLNWPFAAALSVIFLASVLLVFAAFKIVARSTHRYEQV
jgi:putative spermidine/putrescine transport system permease protein